jgi:hypothetical protein
MAWSASVYQTRASAAGVPLATAGTPPREWLTVKGSPATAAEYPRAITEELGTPARNRVRDAKSWLS